MVGFAVLYFTVWLGAGIGWFVAITCDWDKEYSAREGILGFVLIFLWPIALIPYAIAVAVFNDWRWYKRIKYEQLR